jgi:Flagellar transcriptional activator (FlhC).
MATKRDLQQEMQRYRQAERLLQLGARVPVVVDMTRLSSWFLRKLSLEINGVSPKKGQIPNSDQWYLRRKNLLQSSLFCQIYQKLMQLTDVPTDECTLLMEGYAQWRATIVACGLEPQLSIDRAWWLIKAIKMRSLQPCRCRDCQGQFLQPWSRVRHNFRCESCRSHTVTHRQVSAGRSV